MIKKYARGLGLAVTGALLLAGCSQTHASAPDPQGVQGTHSIVIQMPYGFRNVAFTCLGTEGIYVTSRGQSTDNITSGIAVQNKDPRCTTP